MEISTEEKFIRYIESLKERNEFVEQDRKSKKIVAALVNCTNEQHKEFVWKYSFQSDLKKIVNDDLMWCMADWWR